jgi:hypothetical protein
MRGMIVRLDTKVLTVIVIFLCFGTFAACPRVAHADVDLDRAGVYRHTPGELTDGNVGLFNTDPSRPLVVRGTNYWYIRFPYPLASSDFETLSNDVVDYQIAGLDLSGQAAVTNAAVYALAHPRPQPRRMPFPLLRKEDFHYLNLQHTSVDDGATENLRQFPYLQVLLLGDAITDAGAKNLGKIPSLVELNLEGSRITDRGIRELSSLQFLTTLDLSSTSVTSEGLASLQGLPALQNLRLGPGVTDAASSTLAAFPHLRQLDLSQTQMTDKGLAFLNKKPRLASLFLSRPISDEGMTLVTALSTLQRLDATGTQLSKGTIERLARMEHLEELALSQTSVEDADLDALAKLPRLRYLEISDTRVTPAGLRRLQALKPLQVLSYSSTSTVTLGDLKPLGRLPHLQRIIINGKPLGWEAMDYIFHTAQKSTRAWGSGGWIALAWADEAPKALSDDTDVASLPAPTGKAISGLQFTGLRRIHYVESQLDDVIPAVSNPDDATTKETKENFLGEFNVNSSPGKKAQASAQ